MRLKFEEAREALQSVGYKVEWDGDTIIAEAPDGLKYHIISSEAGFSAVHVGELCHREIDRRLSEAH